MQFAEHVKILIISLLIFSTVFITAYTLGYTRLWVATFAVMIVLSGAIAVLARWSRIDSGEGE